MVLLRHSKIPIGKAQDVAKVFQDLLNLEDQIDQDKEHFYVMHLDSRRHIRGCLKSRYHGGRDSDVREVSWSRRGRDTPVT
jgi:hypothetical protein